MATKVFNKVFNKVYSRNPTHRIQEFIRDGGDLNAKHKDNDTALHVAAGYGLITTCKALIRCGANITEKGQYGDTVLHVAALCGHLDTCKMLIHYLREQGHLDEIINTKNEYGNTPLDYAALKGYPSIVELLLDNGARDDDTDGKNDKNKTPFYLTEYKYSKVGGLEKVVPN